MAVSVELILVLGRLLLAAVFAVAGAAKISDVPASQKAVAEFGLPPVLAKPIGLLLPPAELVVAGLLCSARFASWGAAGACLLLLLFAVAIAANLVKGHHPECHCFGQVHSAPIGWTALVRNLTLALCAAALLWVGRERSMPGAISWLAAVVSTRPVPPAVIALAVTAFVLETLFVFELYRQHGRVLLRVDQLERALASAGSTVAPSQPALPGLPIGTPAPLFDLPSVAGARVRLDALLDGTKGLVLMFVEPECELCVSLLPEVRRWQSEYADKTRFAVISAGSSVRNREMADRHGLPDILLQEKLEVSEAYKVPATPSAVLVRPDGTIGSRVATGRAAIVSVLMFHVRPVPLPSVSPVRRPSEFAAN